MRGCMYVRAQVMVGVYVFMSERACVRESACVRACVRVCVRACVCVCVSRHGLSRQAYSCRDKRCVLSRQT